MLRSGPRTADPTARPPQEPPALSAQDRARKEELLTLLGQHRGNVTAVAKAMGKARMQIHRWMKRYGIDPQDMRESEP